MGVSTVGAAAIPAGTSADYDVQARQPRLRGRLGPRGRGRRRRQPAHRHRRTGRARAPASWRRPRRRTPPPPGSGTVVAARHGGVGGRPRQHLRATGSDPRRGAPAPGRPRARAWSTPSSATSAGTERSRRATPCATPSPSATAAASPLTGVAGPVPVPANATLVAGSGRTPDGGHGRPSPTARSCLHAARHRRQRPRRVVFDVVVAQTRSPTGVARLEAQGTVAATGLAAVQTDDPALPGSADPTRTTVTRPTPALAAAADRSAGRRRRRLRQRLARRHPRLHAVGLARSAPSRSPASSSPCRRPAGTSLVDGSVRTRQGAVTAGTGVGRGVGTLAPFQEATIDFRLQARRPAAGRAPRRSSPRGTVTSDQLDPIHDRRPADGRRSVTARPSRSAAAGATPRYPAPPSPVAASADGTVVTQPVDVTGHPDPARRRDDHLVDRRPPRARRGDHHRHRHGHRHRGVGRARPDEDAQRRLRRHRARDVQQRRRHRRKTTVVVDGQMKLGRYTTTFNDMTVDLGGCPSASSAPTTASTRPAVTSASAGRWTWPTSGCPPTVRWAPGGWTMQGCGGGLIFCDALLHQHQGALRDGHLARRPDRERFDLTPAGAPPSSVA